MCQRLRVPIVLELQGESQPSAGMVDAAAQQIADFVGILHKFCAYMVPRDGSAPSGRLRGA